MAALIIFVNSVLVDMYDVINYLMFSGLTLKEALYYLKQKKHLQLYKYYLQQYYVEHHRRKESDMNDMRNCNNSSKMTDHVWHVEEKDNNMSVNKQKMSDNDKSSDECYEAIEMSDGNFNTDRKQSFEIIDYDPNETDVGLDKQGITELYYEDELIYHNPNLSNLKQGISFTVNGRTKKHCERFSINLIIENKTRDVALHLNPRIPQNYVVRNSKIRNVWGPEESASMLPFNLRRGENFSIQILFTNTCFMISINGYHFCKYAHRLPFTDIQTIEVKGDVEDDVNVERMRVDRYPFRLPNSEPVKIYLNVPSPKGLRRLSSTDEVDVVVRIPKEWRHITVPSVKTLKIDYNYETELQLPFCGRIARNLYTVGRVLKVEGRVKLLPQSFYINMQTTLNIWPHPVIALHLNARFSKQHSGTIGRTTMIRNTWMNGFWGPEERSDIYTELLPGKPFTLYIVHGTTAFEIYANHNFITTYKFRSNTQMINAVYIIGDIRLWNVTIENEPSFERLQTLKPNKSSAILQRTKLALNLK